MKARLTTVLATAIIAGGSVLGGAPSASADDDDYPGADWADPTGTLICGIHQIDYDKPRSWKYAAQCQHSERVRMTRAHRAMCTWNEWAGPIVGPMGGRWFCAHDAWALPYAAEGETFPSGEDGDLGSLWWTEQVKPKVVHGMYAMPASTEIELGTITCLQGKNWVKCDDRRTKTGFTAYANGKTTWRGVKGKVRTYADVQY